MVNIFEQPESEKESDVNIPEKLKLRTKWIAFAETVDTCLNHLKGQEHVQLHYIIQTIADLAPGTLFDTEQKLIIATTPLLGGGGNITWIMSGSTAL